MSAGGGSQERAAAPVAPTASAAPSAPTAPTSPNMSTSPTAPRGRARVLRPLVIAAVAGVVSIGLLVGAVMGWQAWTTRPAGEPQAVEFADADLSPGLTGATVLGLGEATHGNAEFQLARLALVQKLPEFRAIVFEEDFGATAAADDYVQGGDGTAEEAAGRFGFALNHTLEMARLLEWIRTANDARAPGERIELIGMDVQRVDASTSLSVGWLRQHDPAAADEISDALSGWTDETRSDSAAREAAEPAVDRLAGAIDSAPDDDGKARAANAATSLQQLIDLGSGDGSYAETRAGIMFANLERTVAEQAGRGNDHTLVFGHNGHLDKTSAAYPHRDVGELAAERWGDGYRVIGTDLDHGVVRTGDGGDRWEVSMSNPSPLRGIFAGTEQGFLEFASASEENRDVLDRSVPMASAGEQFQQWQAWLPPLSTVQMRPAIAYDALIFVDEATPVTPLE
ncbi:MAG: erythromycin esterase family protein [Pseudoclavibacter sp.]